MTEQTVYNPLDKLFLTSGYHNLNVDTRKNLGTSVMKVNCPMGFVRDVGTYLYSGSVKVALMFTVAENVIYNSLRVHSDSPVDASAYAKSKGGGGHRCAAGFTTKRG